MTKLRRLSAASLLLGACAGEPGKLADLVVLSKDILAVPAEEILDTELRMTVLGGDVVYEKE